MKLFDPIRRRLARLADQTIIHHETQSAILRTKYEEYRKRAEKVVATLKAQLKAAREDLADSQTDLVVAKQRLAEKERELAVAMVENKNLALVNERNTARIESELAAAHRKRGEDELGTPSKDE